MRQAKRAAAEGSPAVAKRATRGECMDVIRCVARLARAHPGETYWVHGVSISCSGKRRAAKPNVHKVPEMKKGEEQKKPTKPVAPELPPTTDDDASPPAKPRKKKGAAALPKQVDVPEQEQPAMQVDVASTALLNNRQQRSARRLLAFQELKRAALLQQLQAGGSTLGMAQVVLEHQERRFWIKKARARLRDVFWRAWHAQYRPVWCGLIGWTSLREQHVYRRAARLYYAAFKLDPSKSGRKMVAWLRSRSGAAPTPMEMETVSAGVRELRPGKKPRAEAAGAALSVA